MLKLVPFNESWIQHDKLDLHAIYRRPRFTADKYGEMQREYDANGLPTWDLTTPLPVKHHNRWRAKGFEYVTLADRSSLIEAARKTEMSDWQQYVQDPVTKGPWHYRKYIEGQEVAETAAAQKVRDMVLKYGPDLYEEIRRETDPTYTLPDTLRNLKAETVEDESEPAKRKPGRPRKDTSEAA